MTRKKKWKKRIFWIQILFMLLVLAGSYCAYAFIYRGRKEPPTKRKTTTQEAANYTIRDLYHPRTEVHQNPSYQ